VPETLVACQGCENLISAKDDACPSCGRRRLGEGTAFQVILIMVAIALVILVLVMTSSGNAQMHHGMDMDMDMSLGSVSASL
jgi:hypothetical protein